MVLYLLKSLTVSLPLPDSSHPALGCLFDGQITSFYACATNRGSDDVLCLCVCVCVVVGVTSSVVLFQGVYSREVCTCGLCRCIVA